MPRSPKVYLDDIKDAIQHILKYTKGVSFLQFSIDEMMYDAVVRQLAIIGEAAKNLPVSIKEKYPSIEWKKIAGLRDILIHAYFGIDTKIIWDIVITKIPELKHTINKMTEDNTIKDK